MKIHLVAIGDKMPAWVRQGYEDYARRMPPECALILTELPLARRGKKPDVARQTSDEGRRLLAAAPQNSRLIALDIGGRSWATEGLAEQLGRWLQAGQDLTLMIGGPDGLSQDVRDAAAERWSLSPLTLPHTLVRIVVAEQLYRAWTLTRNHPYHRA